MELSLACPSSFLLHSTSFLCPSTTTTSRYWIYALITAPTNTAWNERTEMSSRFQFEHILGFFKNRPPVQYESAWTAAHWVGRPPAVEIAGWKRS